MDRLTPRIWKVLREYFSNNPEADARLKGASFEMYIALIEAVEVMRATEVFMCAQGLKTEELNEIVKVVDELLDRIDGTEDI